VHADTWRLVVPRNRAHMYLRRVLMDHCKCVGLTPADLPALWAPWALSPRGASVQLALQVPSLRGDL
jgi:hypothetical protein